VFIGLSPVSHFPVGFRLPVLQRDQLAASHAWRTAEGKGLPSLPVLT
jgi:hypothetical protein